jgi:hypothetical protein
MLRFLVGESMLFERKARQELQALRDEDRLTPDLVFRVAAGAGPIQRQRDYCGVKPYCLRFRVRLRVAG